MDAKKGVHIQDVSGQVNVGGDLVGGDKIQNIYVTSQEQTSEELFQKGMEAFQAKMYAKAAKYISESLNKNPSDPDAYYYLAFSLFAGKRPRLLPLSIIQKSEKLLQAAADLAPGLAHIYLFWAFIKYDYYILNKVYEKPPLYSELKSKLIPVDIAKAAEIRFHFDAPKNVVWENLNHIG
jgi:tetratricopeptide (TPR) repeat protein